MSDRLPLDPMPWVMYVTGMRSEYCTGFNCYLSPRAGYSQDEADYA